MSECSFQKLRSDNPDVFESSGSADRRAIAHGDARNKDTSDDLSVSSLGRVVGRNPSGARPETTETRCSGRVSPGVYFSYIAAGGSVFKISFMLFVCVVAQALSTGSDYWIGYWYVTAVVGCAVTGG